MGTRREPRVLVRLPVRIFGTDANGRRFSEDVHTADISRYGTRLNGVLAQLRVGEVVGVTHGESKGRFVVQWTGEPGTERAGQVGLFNNAPEKWTWETPLPPAYIDNYSGPARGNQERRKYPRYKSVNSVQIQGQGQAAPIWGKTVDLSEGGCFIDMQIPLDVGGRVKLILWVKERKLFATGRVTSRRPGFGNGVQFTEMSALDSQKLTEFLQALAEARR